MKHPEMTLEIERAAARKAEPDVHDHKSRKTLIGIALLIAAGMFFYELGHSAATDPDKSPAIGSHRMAHTFHR